MSIVDHILFFAAIVLLMTSIYFSFQTRFVQIRKLPALLRAIFCRDVANEDIHTVVPKKALYAAMSTTLGLGTIVSPVIAIKLGGPGALFGYVLTTFFGSALTYMEVVSAVTYRKHIASGRIAGGPMPYLEQISRGLAKWYALLCLTVMAAWSGAQANQLASFFASPIIAPMHVSKAVTGALAGIFVLVFLILGIKWIARFSAKLVPLMFILYVGSCFVIICLNVAKLPMIFSLIVSSFFSPYQLTTGVLIGGITAALRWGIFKGVHSNEAGLGTQTFPHSMAYTHDPEKQGILAMASTYSAGIVALLGGIVALLTDTWQDTSLPLGIPMVSKSFEMYFSWFGVGIVGVCALLFALGTILGNSYNGSRCFLYITHQKYERLYYVLSACMVLWGSLASVTTFWALSDLFVALMAIPHVMALVWMAKSAKRKLVLTQHL
jgi:AGCS family alanine or glycine:cation symporter